MKKLELAARRLANLKTGKDFDSSCKSIPVMDPSDIKMEAGIDYCETILALHCLHHPIQGFWRLYQQLWQCDFPEMGAGSIQGGGPCCRINQFCQEQWTPCAMEMDAANPFVMDGCHGTHCEWQTVSCKLGRSNPDFKELDKLSLAVIVTGNS